MSSEAFRETLSKIWESNLEYKLGLVDHVKHASADQKPKVLHFSRSSSTSSSSVVGLVLVAVGARARDDSERVAFERAHGAGSG